MDGWPIEQYNDLLEHGLEEYADIWAELAAWDALSDEALELFECREHSLRRRRIQNPR